MYKSLLASFFVVVSSFLPHASLSAFETLKPGVVQVAVTGIPHEGENAPGWTLQFLREFESAHAVDIQFHVVAFDQSWTLASEGAVDLVATGVTVLEERETEGATFSRPILQVKRGLRIHGEDAGRFHTIEDFVGYRVGAVEGMTAHQDLLRRAPEGVAIVVFPSWEALYAGFYAKEIDAVAEGYYVSVNSEINHQDPDFPMIDDHDLIPGQPEYLAFVVRDASTGLLEAVNDLLEQTGFPVDSEWKED